MNVNFETQFLMIGLTKRKSISIREIKQKQI